MINLIKKQIVVGVSLMAMMILVPSCSSSNMTLENFDDNKIAKSKEAQRKVSYTEFSQTLLAMGFEENEIGQFSNQFSSTSDLKPMLVKVTLWTDQNGSLDTPYGLENTIIAVSVNISGQYIPYQNTGKNSPDYFSDAVLKECEEHIERDSQSSFEHAVAMNRGSSSERAARTFFDALSAWNKTKYEGSREKLHLLVKENFIQMIRDSDVDPNASSRVISETPWGLINLSTMKVEDRREFMVVF
jgi:hypothetical protein